MKIVTDLKTGETTQTAETPAELAAMAQLAETNAWAALRETRNSLLASSDWTVLGDSPTPTAVWKAYRQALRDLPANTTDPFNVVWPTPPS